jgi:hypothetical protein
MKLEKILSPLTGIVLSGLVGSYVFENRLVAYADKIETSILEKGLKPSPNQKKTNDIYSNEYVGDGRWSKGPFTFIGGTKEKIDNLEFIAASNGYIGEGSPGKVKRVKMTDLLNPKREFTTNETVCIYGSGVPKGFTQIFGLVIIYDSSGREIKKINRLLSQPWEIRFKPGELSSDKYLVTFTINGFLKTTKITETGFQVVAK